MATYQKLLSLFYVHSCLSLAVSLLLVLVPSISPALRLLDDPSMMVMCVTCDRWTAKSSIEYVANVNRSANLVGVGKL